MQPTTTGALAATPIDPVEPETDENGDPIDPVEPETDEDGNIIEPETDEDGNIIGDESDDLSAPQKKGCGSAVISSAAIIALIGAGMAVVFKKKED